MFQEIPVNEKNIFAFKAIGKLTDDDYQTFLPKLESLISECGSISLLIELEDFHGWEAKAAWDDMSFGMEHDQDFKRIAIIGDKRGERWMIALGNAFTHTEIQYFDRLQMQTAWDWLGEKPPHRTTDPSQAYQHILLATDFSPHSEKAAIRAAYLAQQFHAKLNLLHVLQPVQIYSDIPHTESLTRQELETRMALGASVALKELAERLKIDNANPVVLWGESVKGTILTYAEAQNIDLIVIGSHGRHGVDRLLGSTTNGVIQGARCEVLTMRI